MLSDDQRQFPLPPGEEGWPGAARVPAKGTCVGHPELPGATTPGTGKAGGGAVWGPGTPPLFVPRFPCHADLNNSAVPGLLGTIVFSEGKSVACSAC